MYAYKWKRFRIGRLRLDISVGISYTPSEKTLRARRREAFRKLKDEYRPYVEQGAKLLDEKRPGWAKRNEKENLPWSLCESDYPKLCRELGIDESRFSIMTNGFRVYDACYGVWGDEGGTEATDADYQAFDELWQEAIDKRLTTTQKEK